MREVIYFKRAVYVRALQELGEQAFTAGPPPRPEWLTDEMLRAPHPRPPRRRRQTDVTDAAAGDEAVTGTPVIAGAPAGSDQ